RRSHHHRTVPGGCPVPGSGSDQALPSPACPPFGSRVADQQPDVFYGWTHDRTGGCRPSDEAEPNAGSPGTTPTGRSGADCLGLDPDLESPSPKLGTPGHRKPFAGDRLAHPGAYSALATLALWRPARPPGARPGLSM